jgi:hypothetical protein
MGLLLLQLHQTWIKSRPWVKSSHLLFFLNIQTRPQVSRSIVSPKKLSYSQFLLLRSGSLLATTLEQHQYVFQIPYSA